MTYGFVTLGIINLILESGFRSYLELMHLLVFRKFVLEHELYFPPFYISATAKQTRLVVLTSFNSTMSQPCMNNSIYLIAQLWLFRAQFHSHIFVTQAGKRDKELFITCIDFSDNVYSTFSISSQCFGSCGPTLVCTLSGLIIVVEIHQAVFRLPPS